MRFIPDVSDVDGSGVLLSTRKAMAEAGILAAPFEANPLTMAYSVFRSYDFEQGGWPLEVDAASPSKALAVTLGTNKSACWFGTLPDGTETLWLDQTAVHVEVDLEIGDFPTLSSASVWTLAGRVAMRAPSAGSSRLWFVTRPGNDPTCHMDTSGRLRLSIDDVLSAATTAVATLLSQEEGDPFFWYVASDGSATSAYVSSTGLDGSWVLAATVAASVTLSAADRLSLGTWGSQSNPFRGRVDFFRILNGSTIDSPVVANFTPSLFPAGSRTNAATAVDEHGVTWTLTKPTTAATDEPRVVLPGARRFVLPGVSGESFTSSQTPDLSGGCFLWAQIGANVGPNGATSQHVVGPHGSSGTWGVRMRMASTTFAVDCSADGSATTGLSFVAPSLFPSFGLGVWWVGVYVDPVSDQVTWYDGGLGSAPVWAQVSQNSPSPFSIVDGSALGTPVYYGARLGGADPMAGDLVSAGVGSSVADWQNIDRLHADDADPDSYTWVDPVTGQTNTVNHTTTPSYKVILVEEGQTVVQGDGVNDQMIVVGDLSVMDFDPAVGLSLVARIRMHNTTASWARILAGTNPAADGAMLIRLNEEPMIYGSIDDGPSVVNVGTNANNITYGAATTVVAAFGNSDHEFYTGGVSRETLTTAVGAEPAHTLPTFFRQGDGTGPWCGEILDFWIVRRRLSDSDVATATTEMGF
jgi:hypothetical protein